MPRYRQAHVVAEDTAAAVIAVKDGRTWSEVCANLALAPSWAGALSGIYNGKPGAVAREAENALRPALGLPPLPEPIPVQPCLDCGNVHDAARCHGKPGKAVYVADKPRRQPARWADYPVASLRWAIEHRQPME